MTATKFFINDAKAFVPTKNDSPYKRVLAVGDVHASFDKLLSLWQKLSVTDDDLVIFLGDYLYGLGNKNIETLRWLIEHKKKKISFSCAATSTKLICTSSSTSRGHC